MANNLSSMTGQEIVGVGRRVATLPIGDLVTTASDPTAETIGVYLLLGDDLPGQAILMLTLVDALSIVDWLMNAPPGTTAYLGEIERSALCELGNVCVSSFLNAVAQPGWGPLFPSPPAVMVDMLETILDAVATSTVTTQDTLTIIETMFTAPALRHAIRLWVIPDPPHEYS